MPEMNGAIQKLGVFQRGRRRGEWGWRPIFPLAKIQDVCGF